MGEAQASSPVAVGLTPTRPGLPHARAPTGLCAHRHGWHPDQTAQPTPHRGAASQLRHTTHKQTPWQTAFIKSCKIKIVFAVRCPSRHVFCPERGQCPAQSKLGFLCCPPAAPGHAPWGGSLGLCPGTGTLPAEEPPHMSRQHGLLSTGASTAGAVSLSRGGSPPALKPQSGWRVSM